MAKFTLSAEDAIIYKKERTGSNGTWYTYCTKVSSKDKDDNWQSAFIDIAFKKGVEVNNKAKIKIKNAFPTLNTYNDKTSIRWMIMDFEVIDQGEVPQPQNTNTDFMNIADEIDEDVPFQ